MSDPFPYDRTTGLFDWRDTIVSQYANSPILLGLIESFANALDQRPNLDRFYDDVWNILTAGTFGLDVWGRIVVIARTLEVSTRYFGFDESALNYDPFNVSPFYTGQRVNNSFILSNDAYRVLILAKALHNISAGSIPALNNILQLLFPGRGPCYVLDGLDMTMTYVIGFIPTPVEAAIIESSNVLPRPTGVKVIYDVSI